MGQQHDTHSMTGSHCLFASCVKEAQTPCLCTLSHPHQPGHPNPPESPLYISPPGPLCFPIAPTIKKKKRKKHNKKRRALWCKPKASECGFAGLRCGQQQLKSVTPGPHPSGFQHQPWPLTHTRLQPRNGGTQQGNASMSDRH